MAYSYVQFTGNGSIKTFSVPFTYISKSHVTVKVNGVVKSAGTDYNWDTDSSITFVTAPGNGLTVDIRRASSPSQRLIDFQDGSTLTQDILDADSNQNFFMAQEAIDAVASNIALASDGVYDANGKRIKNVADPVNAQDAVTKNWAETATSSQVAQATTQANAAASSAAASATSAAASAASATSASGSAGTATTKATDASNSATAAATSASQALTSKNAAATSETNAAASATSAGSSATAANTSAVNAATSAASASSSASTATTKASDAGASATASANSASASASSATNAASSASSASASATTAATQATNASNSATAAASSATTATTKASDAATSAANAANSATAATTNGAAQVSLATTQATNAASSATAAATSATNAANSATSAATSASNASSSATAAASSYNTFHNQYQGAYATAPTTRPDSSALQLGDLYFNTTTNSMQVRGSAGWANAGSSVNGTTKRFKYVATAGQTTFSGADANSNILAYDAGYIDAYLNGVRLDATDFTASSGTSFILATGAVVGDELNIVAFGTFSISNFDGAGINAGTVSPTKLVNGGAELGMRNRIINGAMVIDQYHQGASFTPVDNTITIDRWKFNAYQASKFSCQQNQGGLTPPVGFTNYLGFTVTAAYTPLSSEYFVFDQRIEGYNFADLGWGTANAKPISISFWAYSSVAGVHSGSLVDAGYTASYPFSFTIPSSNTWVYVTINNIPGATTGTWGTTNGIGAGLYFNLGSNSSRLATAGAWASGFFTGATGSTQLVTANGATFNITGVQLEKGSVATPFDYKNYGYELSLCQRYYWQISGAYGNQTSLNFSWYNSKSRNGVTCPVPMRGAPTVSLSGATAGAFFTTNDDVGYINFSYVGSYGEYNSTGYTAIALTFTASSASGGGVGYIQTGRILSVSAEL